jgi:hypothetical protein
MPQHCKIHTRSKQENYHTTAKAGPGTPHNHPACSGITPPCLLQLSPKPVHQTPHKLCQSPGQVRAPALVSHCLIDVFAAFILPCKHLFLPHTTTCTKPPTLCLTALCTAGIQISHKTNISATKTATTHLHLLTTHLQHRTRRLPSIGCLLTNTTLRNVQQCSSPGQNAGQAHHL